MLLFSKFSITIVTIFLYLYLIRSDRFRRESRRNTLMRVCINRGLRVPFSTDRTVRGSICFLNSFIHFFIFFLLIFKRVFRLCFTSNDAILLFVVAKYVVLLSCRSNL